MFDVITIGSATKDIFVELGFLKKRSDCICIKPGLKFDIEKPFVQTGGGATNSAVSFSRWGLRTGIITRIGNEDYGNLIKRNLRKEKIRLDFLQEDSELGTALSIITSKNNADRTVFTYRGASENIKLSEIQINKINTQLIYITALRKNSIKILKPILIHAKKNNIKIAINPGSEELRMKWILKYVDILLLNYEEAVKLSGKKEIINILKKLNSFGPKIIAVTNGKYPVHVLYYNKILKANPINVKIASTLGAGDAFCSAFAASIIQNKSIDNALRIGLLNSASVIKHFGAKTGLLSLEEIEKSKLNKIKVKSL